MARKRLHLWVEGRVQGVCFRYYTREEAALLGVAGWVRNLPDGRVEAVAEGDEGAVDAFALWCGHGPPHARVVRVEAVEEEPTGELRGFSVEG